LIAAHADWSVDPRKRWMTVAVLSGGHWAMEAPMLVGDVATFLARLRALTDGGAVALGIDCPVGLPPAYAAQLRGFEDFPAFLRTLTPEQAFFSVARRIDEVSLARPFFPAGSISGTGHKLALARALNLAGTADLARLVDLKTANRPGGGQMFWTLGANQCGKAALAAWRDLIVPALHNEHLKLWPFDGGFRELAAAGQAVIAETYPAEALRQLGLKLRGSKQAQASRQALAAPLFGVAENLQIKMSEALAGEIRTGFGPKKSAEDPFDSLIGVLGVINVLNGNRPDTSPLIGDKWQGWVLGQTDFPIGHSAGDNAPAGSGETAAGL
jgi:hypothetical protein